MPDGWIVFAYAVTYGAMAGYGIWLTARIRRAQRRLERP